MKRIDIYTNDDNKLSLCGVTVEVNDKTAPNEIGIELNDSERGLSLFTSLTKEQTKYLVKQLKQFINQ